MIEGQHDRFKDAPWYAKARNTNIILGGAGGIGSWLGLFLARAGYKVTVFDHDTFEIHNMGGQFVDHAHIGQSKVDSLTDLVNEFSDEHITGMEQMFTDSSMSCPTMMSAFDNMEARKAMFVKWKRSLRSVMRINAMNSFPIFIDGRLLMEQMQIFCVRGDKPNDIKRYEEEFLFDDSEVDDDLCTAKQTTHSAAMIAGFMTGFLTNHSTNVSLKKEAREVPFMTEYFIPLNLMT